MIIVIVNVYGPNLDSPAMFHECMGHLMNMTYDNLIIGGDFNEIIDPALDRSTPPRKPHTLVRSTLKGYMADFGLTDVWRVLHPTERDYTFVSPVHKNCFRLDYFLMSSSLLQNVVTCQVKTIEISDHAPVILNMQLIDMERNSDTWRLNVGLLNDEEFKKQMQIEIQEYFAQNEGTASSCVVEWEACKAYMRGRIIAYASYRKRNRIKHEEDLERTVKSLLSQYALSHSPEIYQRLQRAKYELNNLHLTKVEFALRCTRQRYWESGEKAGKLLASRLKQQKNRNYIPTIKGDQNILYTTPKEINLEFQKYYSKLYTKDKDPRGDEIESFFSNVVLPELDLEAKARLSRPLEIEEIKNVILKMKDKKTPGPDGFPIEWYKAFLDILAPRLLFVYQKAFELGRLPASMYNAYISVIPKPGKEHSNCGNYRPISLMNTDAKILSAVLAQRIQVVISALIHPDQVGFIQHRQGANHLRLVTNLVALNKKITDPAALLSLDAEKAFDKIARQFILITLEKFSFPQEFIKWVKILYLCPKSQVRVNGLLSDPFILQRGTRQGCPLSPLLFDLCLEPLACAIRQNRMIHGFVHKQEEFKLALYADDLLLYISKPETSIPELMKTIELFGRISGYTINWSKSELMPLGDYKELTFYNKWQFCQCPDALTYLGILIPRDISQMIKLNLNSLINNIANDLERWALLKLSIWGKVNTLKMNILPRIIYVIRAISIYIPQVYFKKINRLFQRFIWDNSPPRISLKKMQLPISEGGFNLPDISAYHKAYLLAQVNCWQIAVTPNTPTWVTLEIAYLKPLYGWYALNSKYISCKGIIPPSILAVREIWRLIGRQLQFDPYVHAKTTIWGNPMLKIEKRPFIWKKWVECGIITLDQLIDINDEFLSFATLNSKYHLPANTQWQYLQLQHLLVSVFGPSAMSASEPPGLLDAIIRSNDKLKPTTIIYKYLIDVHKIDSQELRDAWNRELENGIQANQWKSVLESIKEVSLDLKLRLIQQKIIFRIYWTPHRLFRKKLINSDICWRCNSINAPLVHMLWKCPVIHLLWTEVLAYINQVVGKCLIFQDIHIILNYIPTVWGLTKGQKNWILRAFMVAKRLILKAWKDKYPPPFTQWLEDLRQLASYERISYRKLLREDIYIDIWKPFLDTL